MTNGMTNKIQIFEKPWGREELLEKNQHYMVKRLTMKKGCKCSLQYHEKKRETLYVESGMLRVMLGKSEHALTEHILKKGDFMTIVPGEVHRMEAIEESSYLEASTPELDDVVRLLDDYGRK